MLLTLASEWKGIAPEPEVLQFLVYSLKRSRKLTTPEASCNTATGAIKSEPGACGCTANTEYKSANFGWDGQQWIGSCIGMCEGVLFWRSV